MQIASILSDLTSLRVCDHSAALALVSVHKNASASTSTNASIPNRSISSSNPLIKPSSNTSEVEDNDDDLQRARDLASLHYDIKEKYQSTDGKDVELEDGRRGVAKVMQDMDLSRRR